MTKPFLHAWRDLSRLRDPRRFVGWLLRIAQRRAMDELRERGTVPIEQAPEPADTSRLLSPPEALEAKAATERVRRALLRRPEAQREVMAPRHRYELSHPGVTERPGKSHGAVRVIHHRALKALRAML